MKLLPQGDRAGESSLFPHLRLQALSGGAIPGTSGLPPSAGRPGSVVAKKPKPEAGPRRKVEGIWALPEPDVPSTVNAADCFPSITDKV